MLRTVKSNVFTLGVWDEISKLEYQLDGSGARMYLPQSTRIQDMMGTLIRYPNLIDAIKELEQMRGDAAIYLTINHLPPGVTVPIHTDTLKDTTYQKRTPKQVVRVERWHLPVWTNPECWWWDEHNRRINMRAGHWYGPMPYWINHQVGNDGTDDRFHVVLDLDTITPVKHDY